MLLQLQQVEVRYTPTSAVALSTQLCLKTDLVASHTLKCNGQGIDPDLHLSHTVLALKVSCTAL
jgi:hypothetical protein